MTFRQVTDNAKRVFPVYPFSKKVARYDKPIGETDSPHKAAAMIRLYFMSKYGIERVVYGIEIHFDGKAYYMPERKEDLSHDETRYQ